MNSVTYWNCGKSWCFTTISCCIQELEVVIGLSGAFLLCITQCNKRENWLFGFFWGSSEWAASNSLSNFCIMLPWTPSKQCPVIREETWAECIALCLPSVTKYFGSWPWLWSLWWHLGIDWNPTRAAKGASGEWIMHLSTASFLRTFYFIQTGKWGSCGKPRRRYYRKRGGWFYCF